MNKYRFFLCFRSLTNARHIRVTERYKRGDAFTFLGSETGKDRGGAEYGDIRFTSEFAENSLAGILAGLPDGAFLTCIVETKTDGCTCSLASRMASATLALRSTGYKRPVSGETFQAPSADATFVQVLFESSHHRPSHRLPYGLGFVSLERI